jgi:hypothetical protein
MLHGITILYPVAECRIEYLPWDREGFLCQVQEWLLCFFTSLDHQWRFALKNMFKSFVCGMTTGA